MCVASSLIHGSNWSPPSSTPGDSFMLSAAGKFWPPLSRCETHTSNPPFVPVRLRATAYDSSSSLIAYLLSSCGLLASVATTGVPNLSAIVVRVAVHTSLPPSEPAPPRSESNQIWSSLCDSDGSRSVWVVASSVSLWRGVKWRFVPNQLLVQSRPLALSGPLGPATFCGTGCSPPGAPSEPTPGWNPHPHSSTNNQRRIAPPVWLSPPRLRDCLPRPWCAGRRARATCTGTCAPGPRFGPPGSGCFRLA